MSETIIIGNIGFEISVKDAKNLLQMFKHKGYPHYIRLLEAFKKEGAESSLGNPNEARLVKYMQVNGEWGILKDLMQIPKNVDDALTELEQQKKTEKSV